MPKIEIPASLGLSYKGAISTQSALGSVLVNLARDATLAPYLVTVSPDVAMSTNLGGWIHRVGIYSRRHMKNYFKEQGISLLIDWQESAQGRHIELGISETNLFLQLGLLGLADQLYGQRLLPIGTVYDPFVCRALDAFNYGVYSKARFIVAGTPSGISLSYEGGAHQSIVTPGIGVQLPGLNYYEPAFGQELEWILLESLKNMQDEVDGKSAYLRLSTKPIDQGALNDLLSHKDPEEIREEVLRGGYRLLDCSAERNYKPGKNVVHLFVTGAMVSEAIAAVRSLRERGAFANLFVITSPDLLFQDRLAVEKENMATGKKSRSWLEELIPDDERTAPVVTVHDGHPHTLAFAGGILTARMVNLGVTEFGQAGAQAELYRAHGISAQDIAAASEWLLKSA